MGHVVKEKPLQRRKLKWIICTAIGVGALLMWYYFMYVYVVPIRLKTLPEDRVKEIESRLEKLPLGGELLDPEMFSDALHAFGTGQIKPRSSGPNRGFVYKITNKGNSPIFVFGTCHLCGDFYDKKLKSSFQKLVKKHGIQTV